MMKLPKWKIFTSLLIIVGLLFLVEQWFSWGTFFEFTDIHHETFAIAFFAGAVAIYIYSRRPRKN